MIDYLGGNGPTLTPTLTRIYSTGQISPQKAWEKSDLVFFCYLKIILKLKSFPPRLTIFNEAGIKVMHKNL